MKQSLWAGGVGLLFGVGLHLSGMTDPLKVLGFLDVAGAWDPTLAFVMGGAVLVNLPVFWASRHRVKPWLAETFAAPARKTLDRPLIEGAVLFGVGWGLVGLCPGPAIASVLSGSAELITFVVAMLVGMQLHDRLFTQRR